MDNMDLDDLDDHANTLASLSDEKRFRSSATTNADYSGNNQPKALKNSTSASIHPASAALRLLASSRNSNSPAEILPISDFRTTSNIAPSSASNRSLSMSNSNIASSSTTGSNIAPSSASNRSSNSSSRTHSSIAVTSTSNRSRNTASSASVAFDPRNIRNEVSAFSRSTLTAQQSDDRCSRRGCPKDHDNSDLGKCNAQGCGRSMHVTCCEQVVYEKNKLSLLLDDDEETLLVCTKKCYDKVKKKIDEERNDNSRILWNKDGRLGPDDPNNSEAILIKWLTTPGNYIKFRGKGNNGMRKIRFADQIAREMETAGVKKKRRPLRSFQRYRILRIYLRARSALLTLRLVKE